MCMHFWPVLFLSLSAPSIANISGWVYWMVLCYVCVYLYVVTCLSPFLFSPLLTSGCEFYWMVMCCVCVCVWVWPEATCFFSLSDYSIANIRMWVLLNGLCMCECLTGSNLFLSLSDYSIVNISGWVLLNVFVFCVHVYVWPEVTCFSPCLITLLTTSEGEFTVLCMCVCLTRSNPSLSFPGHSNQEVSFFLLYMCMCVWPKATCFSPCLLPPLPTSAGEF